MPEQRHERKQQQRVHAGKKKSHLLTQCDSRAETTCRGVSLWVEVPDPWANTMFGHWQEEDAL